MSSLRAKIAGVLACAVAATLTVTTLAGPASAAGALPASAAVLQPAVTQTPFFAHSLATKKKSTTHKVVKVIDGDTVRLASGVKVRLIGFDAPEKSQCGFAQSKKKLTSLVLGKRVTLPNPKSVKDKDKFGRALRYVYVNGKDVAPAMLKSGYANARYDGIDGYQKHPHQTSYRKLDAKTKHKCGKTVDAKGEKKPAKAKAKAKPKAKAKSTSSSSGKPTATGKEPWNRPGPDLDCSDIRQWVKITGKDYHRLDADGDGYGCDSYR